MSLSFWVGNKSFPVGDASFLKSLFSTIFVRIENRNWGLAYPIIMRHLYGGRVPSGAAGAALKEVADLRIRLAEHPPGEVVWDFEQPESKPPWGEDVSSHVSSLANYFATSDGKNLLDVLSAALTAAAKSGLDLTIGLPGGGRTGS